ncbi:class I SAM-dependent methyltransferase [Cytobacillus sp. Hz8]|uniref:tRNA (mnm(5)s(2)U34)-methyltransferase n=1 Tax=Cytobacillus sp. Hz8 TaxID=3347168 RepID=UPI0035DFA1E4
MILDRVLPFARTIMEKAAGPNDIVVDATLGNGHDTVFLANLVGPRGHVYGFDIQKQAIINTRARLKEHNLEERVTIFHSGHEHVAELIPTLHHGEIKGAIFNLGYLPGGDKSIVTTPKTTLQAVQSLFDILAPEGVIVLVIYHGHEEGAVERDQLLSYLTEIDQKTAHVLQYQFINQKNHPPFIVAIEKK